MDITITAKNISVDANYHKHINVELTDIDIEEVMDNFSIEQFVNKFNISNVLDFIGSDECKDYFDLIDNPE
jgi:hypothetical protein